MLLHLIILQRCSTVPLLFKDDWDKSPLIIQTLALFNQRTLVLEGSKSSWKGDWFLRRKRLQLVDQVITKTIPNIIFFQELLAKKGNKYNSDAAILEHASLAYYDSFLSEYKTHQDTDETEYGATYVRLEEAMEKIYLAKNLMWDMGSDGYLIYQKLMLKDKPIYLFNVNMPSKNESSSQWYRFLKKQMKKTLSTENICYNNIIVAGHFGDKANNREFYSFMKSFDLIDSSQGFCEMKNNCYTENPANPILDSSNLTNSLQRSERILVHKSTQVYNSKIVYTEESPSLPEFRSKYHLYSLTPSIRYGWQTKINLASCLIKKNK